MLALGDAFNVVAMIGDGAFRDITRLPARLPQPRLEGFLYPDGDEGWWLLEQFCIRVGTRVYIHSPGFDFDGASNPKALWSTVGHPLQFKWCVPALYHDGGYCTHYDPRSVTDSGFLTGLAEIQRMSWMARNAAWSAIRVAGDSRWQKTEAEIAKYRALIEKVNVKKEGELWVAV